MRAHLAVALLLVSIFASPSRSQAAQVDIGVTLAPGTTTWTLTMATEPGIFVKGLALVVSSSLESFTPAGPPEICTGGDCFLFEPIAPDFNGLVLSITPARTGVVVLGTFGSQVTSVALVQVLPGDDIAGYTALDPADGALGYSISVVPEPAAALFLLAALTLAVVRVRGLRMEFDAARAGGPASRAWTTTTPGST